MYRNLVTDLLRYERITTTEAKAKEIRPMAEKIITLGKRGDLHARRQAAAFLYDTKVVKKVFDELAPRMRERPGGYLRITAIERRKGDGARMAAIEMVDLNGLVAMPRPQRVTAAPSAPRAAVATALAPGETTEAPADVEDATVDAAPAVEAVAAAPDTAAPVAEDAAVAEDQAFDTLAEESATAEGMAEAPEDDVAAPSDEAAPAEAASDAESPKAEGDGA